MGCAPTRELPKGVKKSGSSDNLSPVKPPSLPPVAAGDLHTVLIFHTRSVALACGDNHFGQCTVPPLPPGRRPLAVAAGRNHTVVLLDNGFVLAFGRNDDGQCCVPPFPPGRRAIAVAAGDAHTVLMLDNRQVIAFGWNGNGQCDVPALGNEATCVAAGGSHTVILLSDGRVIACGNNNYGQCNVPAISGGHRAVAVTAGGYHTVVLLSNGRVLAFGWNCCGQCEIPGFPSGRRATSVAAGESHTVVLLDDGEVLAFGEDSSGQCTVPSFPEGRRAVAIAAGGSHTAILLDKEKVLAFGQNREGQCEVTAPPTEKPCAAIDTARDLSRRSISVRSLLQFFHSLVVGKFAMDRDVTTQQVAEDIVIRLTQSTKSSFVDFVDYHGGEKARVEALATYVAHSWHMRFADLVRAVLRHASGGDVWQLGSSFEDACSLYEDHLDKRYWLCLFCVNQHRSICRDAHIRCPCTLQKYTEASPHCEVNKFEAVARILQEKGGSMIVAIDRELHAPRRAWVMEEMQVALAIGMRIDVSFGSLPAAKVMRRYTCDVEASEGRPSDKGRILARARNVDGGIAEFNRAVTEFVRMSELRLAAVSRKESALNPASVSEPAWPEKKPTRLLL